MALVGGRFSLFLPLLTSLILRVFAIIFIDRYKPALIVIKYFLMLELGWRISLRIVFMGSPWFAVPALERLAGSGYDIAAVYTQPDRPAGRGRGITLSPVKQAAQTLGIAVLQPEKLNSPEIISNLAQLKPEIVIVAAFGQILPRAVLDLPRYGCINIHPSLLPRHRGASPIPAAILAGDEFTGVSIMKMDEKLDTGPVLTRAQIPVTGQDTTGTLTEKLALIAASLLDDVLVHLVRGELTPRPQDDAAATYCSTIDKKAGEIKWSEPADTIWRQVRAFQPWPGAFTMWQGKRLEILQGFPLPWRRVEPGRIIDLAESGADITRNAGFAISTGDGALGVCFVKLEGKRAVSAHDFLRGQRNFIGSIVV